MRMPKKDRAGYDVRGGVGNIVSANAYIPKTFRDHAIGTAPSSQLSNGTGALFGYGYAQSSEIDKRLPIPW
jgi:hypothetical protein